MRNVKYIDELNVGEKFENLGEKCMKTDVQVGDAYMVVSLSTGLYFFLYKTALVVV